MRSFLVACALVLLAVGYHAPLAAAVLAIAVSAVGVTRYRRINSAVP